MKVWESHGLKCKAGFSPTGVPVGYVGLPKDHPDHGKHYDSIDADVHGGLTFADYWYIPEEEYYDLWWVGFDCGHAWDMVDLGNPFASNKDMTYVQAECERLAKQMAKRYKQGKTNKNG